MTKTYEQQVVMKDISSKSLIYVVPLADFHLGQPGANVEVIKGYIDWIAERDNAYTILNGDIMNCAGKDTVFDLWDDLRTPDDVYYKDVLPLLTPIKETILFLTRGNHEDALYRKSGVDFMAHLAHDLGDIPYKPNGGMVAIKLGKNIHRGLVTIYATHGWGGARTIGAKVKKVDELVMAVEADCYVLSHDHTQAIHRTNRLVMPKSRLGSEKVYLKVSRQLLINSGGFISYSGYIQKKGYSPQDMGTPRIRIEFKKNKENDYHFDLHASA